MSDKVTRRAWRQKLIEDVEIRLADDGLDDRARSRFTRDLDMLLYRVEEEKGELPPRTSKVEVTRSQLTDFDVIAINEDGHFHGVVDR